MDAPPHTAIPLISLVQLLTAVIQTYAHRAQNADDACHIVLWPLLLATRERDKKVKQDDLHHRERNKKNPWRCDHSKCFTLPNHLDASNVSTNECKILLGWIALGTECGLSEYSCWFILFFILHFSLDLLQGCELFWPWAGPLQPEREGSEAGKWDLPHVHGPLPRLHVLLHLARQHGQRLRPSCHHPVHHQDLRSALLIGPTVGRYAGEHCSHAKGLSLREGQRERWPFHLLDIILMSWGLCGIVCSLTNETRSSPVMALLVPVSKACCFTKLILMLFNLPSNCMFGSCIQNNFL